LLADYIIIGGGSAGCVLANRLSEDQNVSVVLLEAGGKDWNPLIHIPAGYIKTMVNPKINWMFKTEPEEVSGGREIAIPRGKVLGGSSSINSMIYIRGQAQDYNQWAQKGNSGWSYSDVLPYFKKSENCTIKSLLDLDDERPLQLRGKGGPLEVSAVRNTYPVLDTLIKAASSLGYPANLDHNGDKQDGFGYYQLTQKRGLRYSTRKAYLAPIKNRKNLKVLTSAFVEFIRFEDGEDGLPRAVGLTYSKNGQQLDVFANREVILSAGAIQSPQILELSGIGQSGRLSQLGIECIVNIKGVGENLADHYISRISWKLKNKELSINRMSRGVNLAKEVLRYVALGKGVLSMPAGMLGGFVKSYEGMETPDIQYHIANASFANPEKREFDDFPGLTIGPCQLRPESRGSVHIRSSDSASPPSIRPNFLGEDLDCNVHVKGLKIARKIMNTDLMRELVECELVPGICKLTDHELLMYARDTGATLYHPVSTCRMGPEVNNGDVVNARLKVYGVSGLRVVDASIMPTLISGNTNATTIMIAEKASEMIIVDAK
jgi:choline dehydrogenase